MTALRNESNRVMGCIHRKKKPPTPTVNSFEKCEKPLASAEQLRSLEFGADHIREAATRQASELTTQGAQARCNQLAEPRHSRQDPAYDVSIHCSELVRSGDAG
jgi:hypothetical protein